MNITNVKETVTLPSKILLPLEARTDAEAAKTYLDFFGLDDLEGAVELTTSVGFILFDIYDFWTPKPKAPLAQERELEKRKLLAEKFMKDDVLSLDEDLLAKVKKVFEDDEEWVKLKVSASFIKKGDVVYDQFGCDALFFFAKVKEELMKVLR